MFGADDKINYIASGDAIDMVHNLPDNSIDLVVTDPPYNIGVKYDSINDRREKRHYDHWCKQWLGELFFKLKPGGAVWVFINDENVSELDVTAKNLGYLKRQHVIWYYTFGQSCTKKFARSHTHILYLLQPDGKGEPVFNRDQVLVPSMRQLEYKDKRAASGGKIPDDTWILNPKYLPAGFSPEEDTWQMPRVCGTFKEKQSTPNQLPEALVGRIIRLCSNPCDTVLDMFAGSGTVPAVAKKLGRNYIGFDLSPTYVAAALARLASVSRGDPLFKESD